MSPSKTSKKADPVEAQLAKLRKSLDPNEIHQRPQGGGSVSYVTGEYVKRTLNDIFGPDKWSTKVVMLEHVREPAPHAVCHIRLSLEFASGAKVEREDVGCGSASPKQRDGLELALKQSVTDALKRAAASIGNQGGLSLYRGDLPPVTATDEDVKRFLEDVESLTIEPHHVAAFLGEMGLPEPKSMTVDQLSGIVARLQTKAGRARFDQWLEAR